MCSTCGCRAAEEIDPVESVIVPAPMGRGVAQYYAEGGESATYAPSQDPEGSEPATEPTNASFSAEPKHECITCGEGMDELIAKGQTWNCECCGFLVGTQGEHEGCGFNNDGQIMCNLCYTFQCD